MVEDVTVPVVQGRSARVIEGRTLELLGRVAPQCLVTPQPTPVFELFDRHLPALFGFDPLIKSLPHGLEGLTDIYDKSLTLADYIYDGLEIDDPRSRFAASHEIGHVDLHRDEQAFQEMQLISEGRIRLARRGEIPAYSDPEWQANEYAACLLMPSDMVRLAVVGGRFKYEKVERVAETFKVSESAAKLRLQKLKFF